MLKAKAKQLKVTTVKAIAMTLVKARTLKKIQSVAKAKTSNSKVAIRLKQQPPQPPPPPPLPPLPPLLQ